MLEGKSKKIMYRYNREGFPSIRICIEKVDRERSLYGKSSRGKETEQEADGLS